MSYSASDFVNDCSEYVSDFELPKVDPCDVGIDADDPDDIGEDEELQLLAEQVRRAISDRSNLLNAARAAFNAMVDDQAWEGSETLEQLRAAISEAEGT